MSLEGNLSSLAPPVFDGEGYQVWQIRMQTYLEALDLWEAVEMDYEVEPLPPNPTMAQLKNHKDRKTMKSKAKACLFAAVSPTIFTRIMQLVSAKEIWEYLQYEYKGDDRVRGMKVLNLIRDFELQRMKDSETVNDYSDRLLNLANKMRLLGSEFPDSRITEKLLVSLPEKFEATITTIENTKDLSQLSLSELLNALQAQEQRRSMRQEVTIEGALTAKQSGFSKSYKKKNVENTSDDDGEKVFSNSSRSTSEKKRRSFPPCEHCGRLGHPPYKCWRRPDAKCNNCNELGHEGVICRNKNKPKSEEANYGVTEQEDEDKLFVASCYFGITSEDGWLVDSGCTNHMSFDKHLLKNLQSVTDQKVRIGNGQFLKVLGKGDVTVTCNLGTKVLTDVLFVPDLDQNLLSVTQLLKRGYKVLFDEELCTISDKENNAL